MKSLLDLPRAGKMSLGVYISDLGVVAAEISTLCGFDYMRVDNEHTLHNPQDLVNIIRVANAADIPTLVRVTGLEEITKLLDIGATGIMMPDIETAEQAMAGVKACKYAPMGERGMARAARALGYGLADADKYFAGANDQIAFCVQIESRKGVENIEEIVKLEGVDIVTTGPWDLAQNLGVTGQVNHPAVLEATDYVVKKTLEAGKIMLLGAQSPEGVQKLREQGVFMATICTDVPFLARAMKTHVARFRG